MAIKLEEVILGLKTCLAVLGSRCDGCPYREEFKPLTQCRTELLEDTLTVIGISPGNGGHGAGTPLVAAPAVADSEEWTRESILDRARECVCGERDESYGGPEDSFRTIALLWENYLNARPSDVLPGEIGTEDVAVMMALLKIARLASNAGHMDSWVDLAGYAACGGEIAAKVHEGVRLQ